MDRLKVQDKKDLERDVKSNGIVNTNKSALEYFEIPNRDFNLVCEYAQFDADMVRSKVLTKIKNIYLKEGKNGKNYLSEMPGERLYKNKTFSRSSNRYDRTMSAV